MKNKFEYWFAKSTLCDHVWPEFFGHFMESRFRFLLEFHNNCDFWSKGTGILREFSILSHLMRGAKRLYFLTPLSQSLQSWYPQTPSIWPFSSSVNKTNSHRVLRTLFFCYCWPFLDMVEVVWITNYQFVNYKQNAATLQLSSRALVKGWFIFVFVSYICICILYFMLNL